MLILHRRLRAFILCGWILALLPLDAGAQPENFATMPRESRASFNLALGVTNPQGRRGLREFWLNGPGGGAEFVVHLNSSFALGIGAEMALLYFDEAAFGARWPGVALREKENLFLGNVYIDATYTFLPGWQTRPYLRAQVGGEFIGEASYREVIGGKRYTYYHIGGTPRLSFGLAAGGVVSLTYALGILLELKGTFVHNDPGVSTLMHARAGVQFRI